MRAKPLVTSIPIGLGVTLITLVLLVTGPLDQARAADQQVTNTNDSGAGSLRQAIANVGSGEKITFKLPSYPDTILLTTGDLDINKSLTIEGPGADQLSISGNGASRVFNITGGDVTISSLTITDGNAILGGGAYIVGGSTTVTLTHVSLVSNTAPGGGGIFVSGGSVTLIGGEIVSNTSITAGGVYVFNADASLSDGEIVSNTATLGGGVYVAGHSGVFTQTGDSAIARNTANDNGGGVYVYQGSATFSSGEIINNSAYAGGGVYVHQGSATLSGGGILSNTASYHGGGVYVLSGTVTLGGGQVVSNTAEDGGGVYVAGDSGVFTQTGNSTIKNNTADYGGGVFVHEGSALLSSGEVTSNTADRGGGVHVKSGSVVLTSGKIVGNAASFYGGGVYVSGGILGDGILDQMADGIIAHNTADYGGGVYVSGGNATLSGGEVLSNTASQSGGGLFVTSGGNVELSGGEILSNTATSHGGGVFVEISASVFSQTTGSTIAYNMADCGGGVCVTGGNAALSGGEIISNTATSHGGGVFVSSGNATLSGGQILSNTAEDDGGGVYVKYANAIFTQAGNSTIAHNAANYGGGVYVYEGNATLSGGEIISNTATSHGGGVFVYDGSATLHSGQILSNTATFGGGGVSVAADSAVFTQTGNSIIAHNAANYGGGVYVEDGSAMLSGGEVTSNTADRGGGVHVNFGSVVLTSGKIVSNTADYGGGVCIFWTSAIFTQTGTSTIAYNTAKYDGGGTFVDKGSAVLSGGWIVSNAATSKGSGLYNSTGVVTITTPLTISGDVHQANGTFHASNHDLRIEGDLSLAGGDFHAPSALTLTDRFTHTGGSYHQTQDVLGSAEVGFPKAGGIIINANGNDLSSTQVSIRAGQDCTAQAGETVRHCYDITPTNSTGVSATISFFYNDSERAGHACNALNAHRWDGGGWSDPLTLENAYGTGGRACGANPLSLRVKDVTDFSPFALKSDRVYLPLALRTAP